MENIIYNELVKRGFNVDVGKIEHVVRDETGKRKNKHLEVDFFCNKGSRRYYVQSALCGFSSAAYMGLIFKSKVGLSPLQYRKLQVSKK